MKNPDCISDQDLTAFVVGDLAERDAECVARHLENCPTCENRAKQLDHVADFTIRALRGSWGGGTLTASSAEAQSPGRFSLGPSAAPGGDHSVPAPENFTLHEELGRGAASVVYRATQHFPRRIVALKYLLNGAHASPGQKARFLAEGDAIARLDHPNIVRVHAVGEHQGQLYLCLEYLAGGTLAPQTEGRPWQPDDAARLMILLAGAVQHAHEHGIIHRDLKPANVLLTKCETPEGGIPKVSDFGLARFGQPELTATGAVLGTPSYMAPEQAEGNNRGVGLATDIYALGAILYELLTGRRPFYGLSMVEIARQVIHEEPAPPSHWQAGLPRDLETICLKCLRKPPHGRYASARDLADDLARFLAGEPIRARPAGLAECSWRWCRRHPAWAVVMLLLVMSAVGTSLLSLSLHQALTTSDEDKVHAQQAEKRATDRLWEAYLAQARASRLTARVGQRFQSLAAIRKALDLPTPPGHSLDELRNEAIAALVLPDLEPTGQHLACPPRAYGDVDRTLERYGFADDRGAVTIRRVKDDTEIARLPGRQESLAWRGFSFSGDRRFVQQHFAGGLLKIWRIDTPTTAVVFETQTDKDTPIMAFSTDGQRIAFVLPTNVVVVRALESDANTPPAKKLRVKFLPSFLSFHPHRNELAVAGSNFVQVFDIDSGEVLAEMPHPAKVNGIDWQPHGRILATCCDDLQIRLWNPATGSLHRQPLTGHTAWGIDVKFSHSGDFLASGDWSEILRLWDVRTGRQMLSIPGTCLGFSDKDTNLAVAKVSTGAQIWKFVAGQGLTCQAVPFAGTRNLLRELHAGPRDSLFLSTTSEGVFLRDWAKGEQVAQIPLSNTRIVGLAGNKNLLTAGTRGLLSWPVQASDKSNSMTIGPPEILLQSTTRDYHGVSPDGRMIAIPQSGRGALLLKPSNERLTLGPREDVRYCAISPDSHWVATGNHNNRRDIGATIWDARSGKDVKDFHVGGLCLVGFSPDNRWLLTRGGGFRLWHLETWEPGPDLQDKTDGPGTFAFSPDGKILALPGNICQIRLLETDTGREIACLTVPEQTLVNPYCFSPDGSKLAALGAESQLIYLWDLAELRAALRQNLNLDWNGPAYARSVDAPISSLQVIVNSGSR